MSNEQPTAAMGSQAQAMPATTNPRGTSQKQKATLDLLLRQRLPKKDLSKIPMVKRAAWAMGTPIKNPTPEDEYVLQRLKEEEDGLKRSPSTFGLGRSRRTRRRKNKKNKNKKTNRK